MDQQQDLVDVARSIIDSTMVLGTADEAGRRGQVQSDAGDPEHDLVSSAVAQRRADHEDRR